MLCDLSTDLAYYQPNPKILKKSLRAGCYGLYGEKELDQKLQEALKAIDLLKTKNQKEHM
ncbi:MAG: hypothetical protein NMK33_02860 [Candidatus Cardinium sp.]|nr:MAG: hypothetical protein NMK33_02860 [Candidatus Cardinium sp.]